MRKTISFEELGTFLDTNQNDIKEIRLINDDRCVLEVTTFVVDHHGTRIRDHRQQTTENVYQIAIVV